METPVIAELRAELVRQGLTADCEPDQLPAWALLLHLRGCYDTQIANQKLLLEILGFLAPEMQAKKDRAELRALGKRVLNACLSLFTARSTATALWLMVGIAGTATIGHFDGWQAVVKFLLEHWPE